MSKKIKEVLREFNFMKVEAVMEFLGWKWANIGDVPDHDQIADCASDLLYQARDEARRCETTFTIGTGGLEAKAFWDEDRQRVTGYQLKFIVSQFDNYYD